MTRFSKLFFGLLVVVLLLWQVPWAVNYLTVYELVRAAMAVKQRTIERVACNIIAAVREHFPQVETVECRVTKLAPPLGGKVERVSVTLRG